jgi:hypothetical protein
VIATGALLLRPVRRARSDVAHVRFHGRGGVTLSAPWRTAVEDSVRDPTPVYRLSDAAFDWTSYAVVGRLRTLAFDAAGARFDVVVAGEPVRATDAGIRAWITAAAEAAGSVANAERPQFPRDRVHVLVQSTPGSGVVHFGEVIRGDFAAVRLLLARDAPDDRLPGEWVAVHELSHLGMPWIDSDAAWMYEGLTTYYQEVLRARAGLLTPAAACDRIYAGFGRGRKGGTGRSLRDESRDMRETHAYMRVYWGGTAIALLWDVELRRRSDGKVSLDDALAELRADFVGDGADQRRAGRGADPPARDAGRSDPGSGGGGGLPLRSAGVC